MESTRFFVGNLAKKSKIPIDRKGVRDFVVDFAKKKRQVLAKILAGKLVYLLVDGATRQFRTFIAINVVFFHEGKLEMKTLTVRASHGKQKAIDYKNILLSTMATFGILKSNILCVSADNASVMEALVRQMNEQDPDADYDENEQYDSLAEAFDSAMYAMEHDDAELGTVREKKKKTKRARRVDLGGPELGVAELEKQLEDACKSLGLIFYQRCGVHSLQLAVPDGLNQPTIKEFLERIRGVVRKLRSKHMTHFRSIRPFLVPFNDNATRWSSTHNMLKRFLEIQTAVGLVDKLICIKFKCLRLIFDSLTKVCLILIVRWSLI